MASAHKAIWAYLGFLEQLRTHSASSEADSFQEAWDMLTKKDRLLIIKSVSRAVQNVSPDFRIEEKLPKGGTGSKYMFKQQIDQLAHYVATANAPLGSTVDALRIELEKVRAAFHNYERSTEVVNTALASSAITIVSDANDQTTAVKMAGKIIEYTQHASKLLNELTTLLNRSSGGGT